MGSSIVQLNLSHMQKSKIITFSGDLGNGRQYMIKGPVSLLETDILILEGTYGDRTQSKEDPLNLLAKCVNKVVQTGGVLVIPSFSVGRTQEILFLLRKLEDQGRVPSIPVFLDSPMATKATEIYLKHRDELKLDFENGDLVEPLCAHDYKAVRSTDESMMLCMREGPMVVVSAAGMLTGGRVLHHLKKRLPDARNIILFTGWQAEQTKGRLLQQGFPKIRIHHEEIDVEAEIASVDSLSAHADNADLVNWVRQITRPPQKVYLNHGELGALRALQYRLVHELQLDVEIPDHESTFPLFNTNGD